MHYGYLGTLTTHPGKRGELVAILLEAARTLENNPDCLHYLVCTTKEPETVWVTETWTSRSAHDTSLEPEKIKTLIIQAMPLIASMSTQGETDVVGGKGIG